MLAKVKRCAVFALEGALIRVGLNISWALVTGRSHEDDVGGDCKVD